MIKHIDPNITERRLALFEAWYQELDEQHRDQVDAYITQVSMAAGHGLGRQSVMELLVAMAELPKITRNNAKNG